MFDFRVTVSTSFRTKSWGTCATPTLLNPFDVRNFSFQLLHRRLDVTMRYAGLRDYAFVVIQLHNLAACAPLRSCSATSDASPHMSLSKRRVPLYVLGVLFKS